MRFALASSLFGRMDLRTVVAQVRPCGAECIDLWPAPHGNQREQLDAMGGEAFGSLLSRHGVRVGILTRYDLGPFKLKEEIQVAKALGARLIVTGSPYVRGLRRGELKARIRSFIKAMRVHVEAAEEAGVVIGIENHGHSLVDVPDSLRYFRRFSPSRHLGIALAPYHLPQDPELIAGLVRELGDRLVHFYAWQHGKGCMKKMPKQEELLQLPGRGPLDFGPLIGALKAIGYSGWTEIFMHPVPRGVPILPTVGAIRSEVNRARRYLISVAQRV